MVKDEWYSEVCYMTVLERTVFRGVFWECPTAIEISVLEKYKNLMILTDHRP